MAFNLQGGMGAGAGADMLETVIKRKLLEQQFNAKIAEEARQANLQNAVQQAQLGQGQQRIGLDTQKFGEDRRQFDVTSGQRDRTINLDEQMQPVRIANTQAQTNELLRKPVAEQQARDFTTTRDSAQHGYRLGEIGAQGQNALRVARERPAPLMAVPDGYDENGQPIQTLKPKVAGLSFSKPDAMTAQTRQMGETAKAILPHLQQVRDEASQLNQLGLLGPISGRWRDFAAGKIGSGELAGGNPETARLIGKFQADVGLLQTAVARAHAGARGAGNVTLLQHMEKMMPGTAADFPTFTGSLDAVQGWMQTYADDLKPKTKAAPSGGNAAGATIRARDPQGNLHEAPAGTPLPQGWKLEG